MGTNIVRSHRCGPLAGFAICLVVGTASPALAGECAPPTPECHLANGQKLLAAEPRRAAAELLASYRLDERTETLTLYAQALTADKQYALALETWQRIIVFRESELEAAKEGLRHRKTAAAARVQQARAQEASEQAAAEIMKLWAHVARVRVNLAGESVVVTRGGVEVDASKEVLVVAGGDELVFTRPGGASSRTRVTLAAGQSTQIGVPPVEVAMAARPTAPEPSPVVRPVPPPRAVVEPAPSVVDTRPRRAAEPVMQPRSRTMSRVGLGVGVAGLVGLGVATTLGVIASRDYDTARDLGCDERDQCPIGAASDMAQQANDRARAAQLTAIGGGALVVTGAALFFLGRRPVAQERMTVSVRSSSITVGWSLP